MIRIALATLALLTCLGASARPSSAGDGASTEVPEPVLAFLRARAGDGDPEPAGGAEAARTYLAAAVAHPDALPDTPLHVALELSARLGDVASLAALWSTAMKPSRDDLARDCLQWAYIACCFHWVEEGSLGSVDVAKQVTEAARARNAAAWSRGVIAEIRGTARPPRADLDRLGAQLMVVGLWGVLPDDLHAPLEAPLLDLAFEQPILRATPEQRLALRAGSVWVLRGLSPALGVGDAALARLVAGAGRWDAETFALSCNLASTLLSARPTLDRALGVRTLLLAHAREREVAMSLANCLWQMRRPHGEAVLKLLIEDEAVEPIHPFVRYALADLAGVDPQPADQAWVDAWMAR